MLVLHRRVLDVLSLGDDEAASLGVNVSADAACDRRCRDARDGRGRGLGERPDRLRRDHRPAHDPAARLHELPGGRAALAGRRERAFSSSPTSRRDTVLSPAELPIGVVTAFLGAPFFALVLRTSRERRHVSEEAAS